jgi:hypothetical protein
MRHVNDRDWTKFCNGALKYFETKWTKKLEDYKRGEQSASESSSNDGEHDSEEDVKMFSNLSKKESTSKKDRYREEQKEEAEEEEDDQESFIENMLKTGKFKVDQKREVIKQPRPTREELQ